MKKFFPVFFISLFLLLSCSSPKAITLEQNTGETLVTVETTKGRFTLHLYEDTPLTTKNFLELVQSGFYTGLTFHRYEPGFVIQGGDPHGDGTGGSDTTISLEIADGRSHSRGTIAMARSSDPNSASSQFFINLANNTFLDGNYAVFGEVVEGMDVVDTLRAGDTLLSLTLL